MMQLLIHVASIVQQDGSDSLPRPNSQPRPANLGGLVVASVLLAGWLLAGAVLYRRARRR